MTNSSIVTTVLIVGIAVFVAFLIILAIVLVINKKKNNDNEEHEYEEELEKEEIDAVEALKAKKAKAREQRQRLELQRLREEAFREEEERSDIYREDVFNDAMQIETEGNTYTVAEPAPVPMPEADSAFGPEADSAFGPEADSAFGPEADSAFGPEADSAFRPEADSAFGPEVDSAFGPEADSAFGPEADSAFADAPTEELGTIPTDELIGINHESGDDNPTDKLLGNNYAALDNSVRETIEEVILGINGAKNPRYSLPSETIKANSKHVKRELRKSMVKPGEECYWYNIEDMNDKPKFKTAEMYYHRFKNPEECIDELLMEMYDCALVRTEEIRRIAYGIEPNAVNLRDIMTEGGSSYSEKSKKKEPTIEDLTLIYDMWCEYVDSIYDILEFHADDATIEQVRELLYNFGLSDVNEIIEGR